MGSESKFFDSSRMRLKRRLSRKGMSMISERLSMVASKSFTREGVISNV